MNSKTDRRKIFFSIVSIALLSLTFSVFSFADLAIGKGNGYGYNCDDEYGYGYTCHKDKSDHKGGIVWKKFKHYKARYRKEENRKLYFQLRFMKRSSNPAVSRLFWEMRYIYLAHKFDSPEVFLKLNPIVKQKFLTYKKYHGYKKYREYKERAY